MHIHGLAGLTIGLLAMTVVAGSGIEVAAFDRGHYGPDGGHTTTNINYAVGNSSFVPEVRNFFTFDLGDITGPVVEARLELDGLYQGGVTYSSDDPFEVYELYDVITPLAMLLDGSAEIGGFDDLGSGSFYGTLTATVDANTDGMLSVVLNANAIAAINDAISGTGLHGTVFALGGRLSTLDDDDETRELLFPSSDLLPLSSTRLVLTTIPAPPTLPLLLCMTLASLNRRRGR